MKILSYTVAFVMLMNVVLMPVVRYNHCPFGCKPQPTRTNPKQCIDRHTLWICRNQEPQ